MSHRYAITQILSWLFHALSQKIRILVPILTPSAEWGDPPDWWFWWYTWSDWYKNLNQYRVPNNDWVTMFWNGTFRVFSTWCEEVGTWAYGEAKKKIREWVGYPEFGFSTFQAWLKNLWTNVSPATRWWYNTVTSGLDRLFDWLPNEIKIGGISWSSLWESIKTAVKQWVISTYHNLIMFGANAWSWVTATGASLKSWWDSAHALLDEFRANPTGFIISRLGTTWTRLVDFTNRCLNYYVQIWSQYAQLLADFLADPAGKTWEWLEQQWIKLW